jgi:hypothetical protein
MISCARAAELVSRSMETKLSWWQRFLLRVHLFGCRLCHRFRRESYLLDEAGKRLAESRVEGPAECRMTVEARSRIQRAITREISEDSGR